MKKVFFVSLFALFVSFGLLAQDKVLFGMGFNFDFGSIGIKSNYSSVMRSANYFVKTGKVRSGINLVSFCVTDNSAMKFESYNGLFLNGGYYLTNSLLLDFSGGVMTNDYKKFDNFTTRVSLNYYLTGMYFGVGAGMLSMSSSNFIDLQKQQFNAFLKLGFDLYFAKRQK